MRGKPKETWGCYDCCYDSCDQVNWSRNRRIFVLALALCLKLTLLLTLSLTLVLMLTLNLAVVLVAPLHQLVTKTMGFPINPFVQLTTSSVPVLLLVVVVAAIVVLVAFVVVLYYSFYVYYSFSEVTVLWDLIQYQAL